MTRDRPEMENWRDDTGAHAMFMVRGDSAHVNAVTGPLTHGAVGRFFTHLRGKRVHYVTCEALTPAHERLYHRFGFRFCGFNRAGEGPMLARVL